MKTLLSIICCSLPLVATAGMRYSPQTANVMIMPGVGYSNDTQQITKEACFNVTAKPPTSGKSTLEIAVAKSFSDLQKKLKYDISISGHFGMFSASAVANYLHVVENKDYSLSLNYYEYIGGTELVQINVANPLNANGQAMYDNNKKYFGLICGDKYIDSYQLGSILLMGLKINFQSHSEKKEFEGKVGTNFGDIISASAKIQNAAIKYNMNGEVYITAFQMGGKPQQLSQILSKDANGDYYILRCDLKNMEKCVKTADGLLSYATDNYPNQISYSDGGKGLEPLGLGFAHYTPIRYIGLTPSDTLVTPQVQKVRLTLASIYKANQYYQEKAYQIMNGYPVQSQFLKPSTLYANASLLYDIAKSNINILKPAQDADAGALGCFDYPDQCEMVAKSLQTSIKPITDSNLTFLEEIQYKYLIVPSNIPPGSTLTSYFYPLGNSQYAPSIAIYNTLVKQWPGFDCSVSFSAQVNSGVEKYHLGLSERDRINNRVGGEDYYFNGSSSNNGLSYHGDAYTIDKIGHQRRDYGTLTSTRVANPFYFKAYQPVSTK